MFIAELLGHILIISHLIRAVRVILEFFACLIPPSSVSLVMQIFTAELPNQNNHHHRQSAAAAEMTSQQSEAEVVMLDHHHHHHQQHDDDTQEEATHNNNNADDGGGGGGVHAEHHQDDDDDLEAGGADSLGQICRLCLKLDDLMISIYDRLDPNPNKRPLHERIEDMFHVKVRQMAGVEINVNYFNYYFV